MPGFVHGAEDAADRIGEHAGCDADVADRELGGKWVVGLVLAAAVEVIAEATHDLFAELPLCRRIEDASVCNVRDLGALADLGGEVAEPGAQLAEDGADGCDCHAVVGASDVRVGDVLCIGK